jgi:hypothetical protein
MTTSSPPRTSKRFADLPDADPACEGCGYCLRGQTLDGRCPECGTATAVSAAKVADRYAGMVAVGGQNDERRQSDLRWGPWLILAAIVIDGVATYLPGDSVFVIARSAMRVAACILAASGVYASTRSVVGVTEPLRLSIVRRLLRLGALTCVVGTVLAVVGSGMHYRSAGDLLRLPVLFVPWIALMGSTLYFVYAFGVARALRATAAAASSAIMVLLLLGIAGVRVYDSKDLAWNGGFSLIRSLNDPIAEIPILGSGFVPLRERESRPPMRARLMAAMAAPAVGFAILEELVKEALRSNAAGWLSLLTLLQLALMSGHRAPAGSAENSEASSHP